MSVRTFTPVFHTVEARKESSTDMKTPVKSQHNTWLGEGYYFWDGFIEWARWWAGVKNYQRACIYEAKIVVDEERMIDLVGDTSDLRCFRDFTIKLKKIKPNETITVLKILTLMQNELSMNYKLIRARSEHLLKGNNMVVPFDEQHKNVCMRCIPAIQMCATSLDIIKEFKLKECIPSFS